MSTLKIKRENGKIFCPLADSWHIETPEEKVRQEYIKILVENYGYSLDQMAQEIKVNIFAEQFGVIAVHLPKYILGQFFGKLCHIMIAIPSSWCGIELGVNGSLLKVRPNILFLNFIAPSFLARSLAGHLAAFE